MNTALYPQLAEIHNFALPRPSIIATGISLPEKEINSDDIMKAIDCEQYHLAPDFLSRQVGVHFRRYASQGTKPSILATEAAAAALDLDEEIDVDMLVFCGMERDYTEPSTAHLINNALDLQAFNVYDVTDACFGFFRGLQDCARAIQLGEVRYALVVTSEILSASILPIIERLKKGMPMNQAKKLIGFLTGGDAGGAVLLGASDGNHGFGQFSISTMSQHSNKCYYGRDTAGRVDGAMHMGAVNAYGKRLSESVVANARKNPDYATPDHVLTHQTGHGTQKVMESLELAPSEKYFKTYPRLGNIASATFPVNYHLLNKQGLKEGDNIGCVFSGSGLVVGHVNYRV